MPDDYDDLNFPACTICGAEMDREPCWYCHGASGFHSCLDDCCPCLNPDDDLNETCEECHGEGAYWICPALPHTDEQMAHSVGGTP